MTAALAALFARLGIPAGLHKPVGYIVAGIALAALLWAAWAIWLHFHDKAVIAEHEAPIAAAVATKQIEAEREANARDAERRLEDAKAAAITEEAIRHAETENPAAAVAPAGPVSRAAVGSLRRRAGAAGSPAN